MITVHNITVQYKAMSFRFIFSPPLTTLSLIYDLSALLIYMSDLQWLIKRIDFGDDGAFLVCWRNRLRESTFINAAKKEWESQWNANYDIFIWTKTTQF